MGQRLTRNWFPSEPLLSRRRRRHVALLALSSAALLLAVSVAVAGTAKSVGGVGGLPLCEHGGATKGPVSPWRMGAVQFFTPTDGIGLTASTLICSKHSKTGSQVSLRTQPVRLALSSDGGRSWRLTGTVALAASTTPMTSGEQLVAASSNRVWAIGGNGGLLATADKGRSWRRVMIPGRAVQLARSGDHVWSLTCVKVKSRAWPSACRPQLWRAPIGTGAWVRVMLPKLTAQDPDVNLAIASGQSIVVDLLNTGIRARGEMAISTNGGSNWHTRPDPIWDGHPCTGVGDLTATAPSTFWLLCLGGAAAGSSTKALLESTNSASTWSTVSAVTSLVRRPPRGSLPLAEPSALAAGSTKRVWLATTNGLAESADGGKTWNDVPAAFDPGGWPTVISVLDARHAWLLAPGAGLWSTTDGENWKPTGSLHTG